MPLLGLYPKELKSYGYIKTFTWKEKNQGSVLKKSEEIQHKVYTDRILNLDQGKNIDSFSMKWKWSM